MRVGNAGNNWWANASGRNPGIGNWNMPLAARQAGGTNQAGTSQAARNSIVALRQTSEALTQSLNAIRGIGNTFNQPMQARRPVSQNTEALNINSFDPNRIRGAGTEDFSVEVLQLAQTQTHEGEALDATSRASEAGFSVGAHHIEITIGNRRFDFNFNVSENDTVRDVQTRIANAINARSDVAVTASVNFDQEAGTSALVLSSSQSGIDPSAGAGQPNFSVRSVTGNAVETAGVDMATTLAQNAAFRVTRGFTGAVQTSRSNDVDLGFGITAELRQTGTTEVQMGRDTTTQQNAFRHMVNSFNDLVEAARSAGRGSALASELGGIVRNFSSQLERIGISLNSEGRMQIDETRMAAAAESGELEEFARRDGFNFMSRLGRTADSVRGNPAAHVEQTVSSDGGFGGFDPSSFMDAGINFSPMQSVSMTRFMNLGMLFDSLL